MYEKGEKTMNESITWKRNQFLKFYAKMKIRVGGQSPMDINKGDEFEYDGTIVKYAGMELNQPQMRGAVQAGWASLNVAEEEVVSPVAVPRNIAVAKTVNTDLSRVQRRPSSTMENDDLDERTVLNVADRHDGNNVKAVRAASVKDTSDQDGQVIGRVKTSTKLSLDVSSQNTAKIVDNLENGAHGRPEYLQKTVKEGVQITSNLKQMNSNINPEESTGEVIGQVRNSNKKTEEGIDLSPRSKESDQIATLMAEINKLKAQIESGPKKKQSVPVVSDARIRVARTIDPDFPLDWDFSGKLADRLERAKSHGISDSFLEALFAAEGDQMRKLLKREYPEKFGSE